MEKKYRYRNFIMFIMGVIAVALVTGLFSWVWIKYFEPMGFSDPKNSQMFYRNGYILMALLYAAMVIGTYLIYDGFKYGFMTTTSIVYSQSIAIVIVNFITYFQMSLIARHMLRPIMLIIVTGMQIPTIIIWSILASAIYYTIYPPRRMIIVYGSSIAETLMSKIGTRKEKYKICASIKTDAGFERICEKLLDYDSVVLCDVDPALRNKILKFCFDNSLRAYITPDIADIIIRGADNITLFDTPLLLCRSRGFTNEQRFVKRVCDIIISFIMIIIFSIPMIITAICIKVYDGGHVFYKQRRSTVGGKVFEIYKFRSMIEDAEKNGKARLASVNDDRITPIGRIIRRYRIDELPQLFNILKGDMSVVGPRPERPEIIDEYLEQMPEFKYRLKVKAGLTGYAQIVGKYNTTAKDKLKMDLMYIENYSFLLDIKLIMMTVKIMLIKESTEGVKEEKKAENEAKKAEKKVEKETKKAEKDLKKEEKKAKKKIEKKA